MSQKGKKMEMLKLNDTPVRTSRNFNINNISLENVNIPDDLGKFENVEILNESSKVTIDSNIDDYNLTYGLGTVLTEQVKNKANQKLKLTIDGKTNREILIDFKFDKENINLVDNIEIVANEDSKATVILKYELNDIIINNKNKTTSNLDTNTKFSNIQCFHNGIVRVLAKQNSNVNVIIVNLLNSNSNNFMSIENSLELMSKVKYTIVDFGGKNSITNYYSNLLGEKSDNIVNTIYLGRDKQLFDLNYIGELRGEKSNIDIEVQGALNEQAKKHFKGTIDFKRGAKKAKGNENEACMLLSDSAKSLALPMLLCSEEDVEGNHSCSAGKIGEKELFYIMSRGFELKDAMKLMVRARFNKILGNIKNEEIKEQILVEIDKRLS